MRKLAWIAVLFAACGGDDKPAAGGDPNGGAKTTGSGGPRAAVEAFFAAAAAKDKDALGKLFSSDCEKEFKKIVDGTVSAYGLTSLQKMFENASINDTRVEGDTAAVDVKLPEFPRGKETLNLVKEGGVWRVQGF